MIEGMGELHLDIIVDRLRREFKASRLPLNPHPAALLLSMFGIGRGHQRNKPARSHTADSACPDVHMCLGLH